MGFIKYSNDGDELDSNGLLQERRVGLEKLLQADLRIFPELEGRRVIESYVRDSCGFTPRGDHREPWPG